MNAADLISGPWVERLGWTLVHFLWQGVLILAVYTAVRKLLGRTSSPNARYLLACGALAALVAAPLMTFGLMVSPEVFQPTISLRRIPLSAPTGSAGAAVTGLVSLTSAGAHESTLTLVVMLWLAGAIAFWVRLMAGWIIIIRMRSTQVRPAQTEWQDTLNNLCARIRLSRPVRLLVSARVQVPTVIGWLRPVVLMPIGALTGLPAEHVEAVLIHELAHIRRHDYLVNFMQSVAEALLFYHPAVWWVSAHIRTERELCCDDIAVSVSGDVVTYARALTELESYRPAHLNGALAANGGSLEVRIARLLGESRPVVRSRPGPSVIVSAVLLLIAACGVFGQSPALPQFEVVSIKQSAAGPQVQGTGLTRTFPDGRFTAEGTLLKPLTSMAYGLRGYQILGGPNWIDSARYDMEAKANANTDPQQRQLMLQSLLKDKFKLKFHRETQFLPVYLLTAAKSGIKLQPPKEENCRTPDPNRQGPPRPQPAPDQPLIPPCGRVVAALNPAGGRLAAGKATMETLTYTLSNLLGRSVIDKTGFTGTFDAYMAYTPDEALAGTLITGPFKKPAAGGLPTIFTAIEEQLGLNLESGTGPVEVLVIDDVERPAEN
jgi:uncharacterized protein (TIGR03435 family)